MNLDSPYSAIIGNNNPWQIHSLYLHTTPADSLKNSKHM